MQPHEDLALSRGGFAFRRGVPLLSVIVGHERMKLALLLSAIDWRISGVLIRGEKGTAKSTAVRGLAALLPEIAVHASCTFSCDPAQPQEWCPRCRERGDDSAVLNRPARVVTLPLNATEDMVLGGLDFSATLKTGKCIVQAGLLAKAHRGILYVDEVNLLDDHLVNVKFAERWQEASQHLAKKITDAVSLYPEVTIRHELLFEISSSCIDVGVDGHRGDIIMLKTAKTLAAYHERTEVVPRDIEQAAQFVLPHRVRRQPLQDIVQDVRGLLKVRSQESGVRSEE